MTDVNDGALPKKRRLDDASGGGAHSGVAMEQSQSDVLQPAASHATLTVVQSGCAGYGQCMLLRTTNSSYLFNAPEVVQRMLGEHSCPLSRLQDVLLTRSAASAAAGLPGLALSLQAAGCKHLRVHGPRNGTLLVSAVRPYAEQRIDIDVTPLPWDVRRWSDGAVTVHYVPLLIDQEGQTSTASSPQSNAAVDTQPPEHSQADDQPLVLSDTDAAGRGSDACAAIVYVVTLPPRPPKIDPLKCKKLRVPFGRLIGELQSGRAITLPDGRRIEPKEVYRDDGQPAELPATFLVVDCPNSQFVRALVRAKNDLWGIVNDIPGGAESLQLVAHLSPSDIFHSEEYCTWMKSIPGTPCHLVLNEDAPYLPHSEGIFRLNLQLNYLHDDVYPRLYLHDAISKVTQDLPNENLREQIVYGEPFLTYILRGGVKPQFERTEKAEFDERVIIEATESQSGVKEAARAAQIAVPSVNCDSKRYPEIIMLGTGSAVPSKHRNVTSTLVYTDESHSFMVDCGEGTLNQLYTMLGRDAGDAALRSLRLALITHMHQDHYLGLFAVLQARRQAFEAANAAYEPLHVVGSKPLFGIIALYSRLLDPLGDAVRMVSALHPKPDVLTSTAEVALLNRITPVKVYHAMMPWAYIVETKSGRKLAFSGDCRPDDRLVGAAQFAHLLIHEATFDPARQADAIRKRHSTTAEACDVARRARCESLLLTHFSARFAKLPIVTDECFEQSDPPPAVASDFMRFSEQVQARHLHKLIPGLRTLFAKEHAGMVSSRDLFLLKQSIKTRKNSGSDHEQEKGDQQKVIV